MPYAETVENVKQIKWYRKPVVAFAASAALVLGIGGAGFAAIAGNGGGLHRSAPATTAASTTDTETSTEDFFMIETTTTDDGEQDGLTYISYAEAVNAKDIYDVKILDLPEKIDGMDYFCVRWLGLNENKLMVGIDRGYFDYELCVKQPFYEYGFLDLETMEYEKLTEVEGHTAPENYDNGIILFVTLFDKSLSTDFIEKEYKEFKLFDVETKEFKTIYHSENPDEWATLTTAFSDGKVYFDSREAPDYTDMAVYVCDTATGKTEKIADKAHDPFIVNGELWYKAYDDKWINVNRIVNYDTGKVVPIDVSRSICTVCDDGRVFDTVVSDERFGHCAIVEVNDDGTSTPIIQTHDGDGEYYHDLSSNNFCIAWSDGTGEDSTPCVYDLDSDSIVYFDDLDPCYYNVTLTDNMGLIFDQMNYNETHQVCLFQPKTAE